MTIKTSAVECYTCVYVLSSTSFELTVHSKELTPNTPPHTGWRNIKTWQYTHRRNLSRLFRSPSTTTFRALRKLFLGEPALFIPAVFRNSARALGGSVVPARANCSGNPKSRYILTANIQRAFLPCSVLHPEMSELRRMLHSHTHTYIGVNVWVCVRVLLTEENREDFDSRSLFLCVTRQRMEKNPPQSCCVLSSDILIPIKPYPRVRAGWGVEGLVYFHPRQSNRIVLNVSASDVYGQLRNGALLLLQTHENATLCFRSR